MLPWGLVSCGQQVSLGLPLAGRILFCLVLEIKHVQLGEMFFQLCFTSLGHWWLEAGRPGADTSLLVFSSLRLFKVST